MAYSKWRHYGEMAESLFYGKGWAARLAYSVRLQGRLHSDKRDFFVRGGLWPESLRIAFASDFHAGPLTDPRLFRSVVATIKEFNPHVVLLGGDFISLHHRHVAVFIEHLQALRPAFGVFAVLGNHDLWEEDRAILAALENAGVTVLVNQSHILPEPFHHVSIFGLDEPSTGSPDASLLSEGTPKVQVVLMHSPLGLTLIQGHSWHLAFCGHTHGGQVALPGGIPIFLPRSAGSRHYSHGCFNLANVGGGKLIVSRGVGMSFLPIRVFARSEIHLCTLHSTQMAHDDS